MRQGVTSENLFVLFIFCNPTDNCDGKGNRTSLITNKTTAWLSHRNKLFRRIRDCLYISCSSLWQFSKMFLFINQFLINFFGQLHFLLVLPPGKRIAVSIEWESRLIPELVWAFWRWQYLLPSWASSDLLPCTDQAVLTTVLIVP